MFWTLLFLYFKGISPATKERARTAMYLNENMHVIL